MTALLIKDLSPKLHSRLKEEAKLHHRTMNREALAILEQSLMGTHLKRTTFPKPISPALPISSKEVIKILRKIRDEE